MYSPKNSRNSFILRAFRLILFFGILFSFNSLKALPSDILLNSADSAYAKKNYELAARLYETINRNYPFKEQASVLFKLSCAHSQLGQIEKSVLALHKAIKKGYGNYSELINSGELSNLRQSSYWSFLMETFQKNFENNPSFYWGIYAGILFIILIYNIMLFISTKDMAFVYSALLLLFSWNYEIFRNQEFGLFMLSNLAGWDYCKSIVSPVNFFISLSALSLTFYLQSLLRLKELLPKMNWVLRILAGIFAVFSFTSGFTTIELNTLIFLFVSLTLLFYFIVGIISWAKGYRPARFFVIADIIFILCVLSILFNYFQIVDSSLEVGQFKARHIGLITFYGLITLATGDKIITLQKEKELAQEKALEVLEQKVKERTSEVTQQKQLVEEKQKEIIESISYAKRLQEAILPPREFINKEISENFVLYAPKDLVAGDFYWAEKINGVFLIAAADSTGHGVPGAMVSVVCSNALNRAVKEFELIDTGKILDKTRELVIETFDKSYSEVKDGMDISLLAIDTINKKILWSGANNPLWYIHPAGSNALIEIKANKQPIGKSEFIVPFNARQIDYKPGTIFYLFTDGFADQFGGPKGKKFKYKPFFDLLKNNAGLSMQDQAREIQLAFKNWKGDLEQVDDLCILGIKLP